MINLSAILHAAEWDEDRRDRLLVREDEKHPGMLVLVEDDPTKEFNGVWAPYDKALAIANHVGVTEELWPLFVHNLTEVLSRLGRLRGFSTALQIR
ncbi:hypothetical protein QBC34DRAFT_324155 [Podospora aff. communis PSN243]|uniref:HTH APSES-type domain-containing protein n=1 Tax=Podospora aff. communis PSN243 TaxID=3040156 RepID=A0AAV9GQM9_9PEZI|nr:hypothetical protein QBC34DRAFT_324155 [Podospora aff. communis PSN243]